MRPGFDLWLAGLDQGVWLPMKGHAGSTNCICARQQLAPIWRRMGIVIIFMLGVANFALHQAVLESGHSIVRVMRSSDSRFTPRITLALEFGLLLTAMLLVGHGYKGWGWTYAIYSVINGFTAWLLLTRRI